MKELKLILGIDTSCDDTSAAITEGTKVLSNVVSSQVELHRKWGGIVPDIARRAHEERIGLVIKETLKRASIIKGKSIELKNLDAVAVTYGPGLAIALEIGITKAKEISKKYQIPLIPVNHMEGHLLSSLAANNKGKALKTISDKDFPLMGVLVSGGHTEMINVNDFGKYTIIGETLDDAAGEAYDKVARMLDLGYPGGPVITELAKQGDKERYKLPIPMRRDDSLNFSFSGLKTAVFYLVKKLKEKQPELTKKQVMDISASFEYSVTKHLTNKLDKALKQFPAKVILVGGGVGSSPKVRSELKKIAVKNGAEIYFPFDKKLYMDNGAMIALAGYFKSLRHKFESGKFMDLDREPRASIQDER
jgi:N6-L-threonylcarbamoyladenine synthase